MSKSGLKDFEEYLDRYCSEYKVTKEEALTHAVIREIANYYGIAIAHISHLSKVGEDGSDGG